MQNEFTKPEFISGVRDPTVKPPEDTNDRDVGTFLTDEAIALAKPVLGAVRTGTQLTRMGVDAIPPEYRPDWLGDASHGPIAEADKWVGRREKDLEDARSARDKALDTDSPIPGPDDRSLWREPGAAAVHMATPIIPYAVAAWYTGGASVAAQIATATLFGGLGVGSDLNKLRDAADNLPVDQLKKLPQWQEFGGDAEAARNQLFKDTIDLKTEAATFGVNAATFGAFLQGLGTPAKRALAARMKAALIGGTEGAGIGATQSTVGGYSEQLGKVRRGEQENIDPAALATETKRGTAFGVPMGLYHGAAPPHLGAKEATPWKPPPGYDEYGNKIPDSGGPPAGYDEYGNPTSTPPAPPGTPPPGGPGTPPPGALPPAGPAATPPPTPPPTTPGGPAPLDTDVKSVAAQALKTDAPTPPPMQPQNIFAPPLPNNKPGISETQYPNAGPTPSGPAGPSPALPPQVSPGGGPPPAQAGALPPLPPAPQGAHRYNPSEVQKLMGVGYVEAANIADHWNKLQGYATDAELQRPVGGGPPGPVPDSRATAAPPPSSDSAVPRGPAPAEATAAPAAPVPSPVARTEPAAGTAPVRTPVADRNAGPIKATFVDDKGQPITPKVEGFASPEEALASMTPEDAAAVKELIAMGTHKGNASSVDEQRLQAILAKYGLGMPIERPPAAPAAEQHAGPVSDGGAGTDWIQHNVSAVRDIANRLGLTSRIKELAERGDMTAEQISKAIGGRLNAAEVRAVRESLGIKPIGEAGFMFGPTIPQHETPPQGGGEAVDRVSTPPSDEAQAASDRSFEQLQSANLVDERLQRDGKLFINSGPEGYTAHEGGMQAKLKLDPNPAERKAAKRAEANANLADTPEERIAAGEELKTALRPAVERAIKEQQTPTVTPGVKPLPDTSLGARLSPDQQQHMRDQATAAEASRKAAVETALQAEHERNAKVAALQNVGTPPRTGKVKTGVERALEASIKAWKASETKTPEAWVALRKRAMQADYLRREGGLEPKYVKQVGERPGGPEPTVTKEMEQRFGQKREIPSLEGEKPTPAEAKLIAGIEKLRADMRAGTPQGASLAVTDKVNVALPTKEALTPQQYNLRIKPLLAEARRLDAGRTAAGKAAIFEKALPNAPGETRSPEQRYNSYRHTLSLYRHLTPNQFIRIKPVRDALEGMQAVYASPAQRALYVPEWVRQKLSKVTTGQWVNLSRSFSGAETDAYRQARKEAGDRLYQAGQPSDVPAPGLQYTRHVQAREQSEKGAPQKIEHTGAFPMSRTEILTHRQFETEQERLRREHAADQPAGQKLRQEQQAEEKAAEARRKTPEAAYAGGLARIQQEKEARAAAAARGEQGTTPEADRRIAGELPTPEKLKALVDAFWGTSKDRAKGKGRTTTTRAAQFVDRDWAIGQSIREVLQKHFGEDYGKLDTLLDRLQIGPKPTLPKVLKETPKGRGSRGALEAHAAARKLYTAELKFWRDKQQANMLKASVELSGVIKEVEALAKEYIQTQRGISTPRGGSIHWDMPTGEQQPGTPYTRYKIGVSTEKSDMFNMLADMMTARNHVDVGMDILRGRDNELNLDRVFETGDQRTIDRVSRDVSNWASRLASDWRNWQNNDLAAIREERSVRNQPIEEQKRAAQQKKLEGGEEGETSLSDEVRPLDEPETPEEAAIRREEEAGLAPKHIETRYEEAQRLTRERKGFEAMMAVEKSDAHLTTEQSQRAAELRTEIAQLLGKTEYPVPEKTGRIKRTPNFEHEGKASEGKVLKGQALARAIKARGGATEPIGRRITTEERLAQIKDELDQLGVTKVLDPETGKMREATQAETDAEVNKVKKNRRNRLQDGPAPETAPQYMAEVHSARDALTDANPQHPLISDPEPASASIERAKDIVKRGEAGDVSDFITPEFLDKLSKANDGVAVVHAPLEVVRGERNEGQAFYQPNHDRIVLSNDVSSGDYVKNVVHEQVHAATEHLLVNDPEFRGEVEDLRQTAERAARRAGVTSERLRYGLTDVHEFLSESQSNPEFRALLQRSAAPGKAVIHGAKTVMNALYATIQKAWRKVAGVKDGDTALDVLFRDTSSVLGATDRLVAKTLDRLSVEGRTPGSDLADRRFRPNIGDIARKSRESLSDTVHSNALQDIVMGLHTTWDFTHRGTAEWQKLSKRIAENMSTTATERSSIAADNNVRMRDTAKWLNALGDGTRFEVEKFLHDETMHSAFADVGLDHAKNKHISKTALADAQTRRLHDLPGVVDKEGKPVGMRQRFDDLVARVPHFAEHRDALHKFFADIENNVRNEVSKALIEHLRILPESADTPEKKAAAVDLIQKHVLGEKLTKGEKDTLEAIKGEVGRKNFRDIVSRIRRTPELTRIAGPYIPLTRHGGFAVSGHFNMPEGGRNGERLANTKDREGRPVDDGVRMFDSRADAEAFEQRMYDKFGISQTDGGEWFIDKRTGKRAREYTEEEMKMWHDGLDPDMRNRLLKAKEVEPGIVEEGPNQYEKKYWVKMQPQLLEFHERKSEAAKSTAAWRKLHGDDISISDPEPVHRGLGKQNEKYASTQMQKLIDRAENSPSLTSLEKDQQAAIITALTLQSAKLSLRRGVRQSFKPRGYVQGFDPHDLVRNMENYSGQTAGYLANTKGYVERMAARKALDDYLHETRYDGLPEHTNMVRMRDELYRKMDEPAENTHETLVDRGTGVLIKWSLIKQLPGFSYFTANATEVAVLGAPNMMDRHSPGEVAAAIHQGYRIFGGKFAPFKAMARGLVDAYHTGRGQSELNTQWKDYVNKAISNRAPPDMRAGMQQFFERIHRIGLMEPTTGIEYQKSLYNPSASRLERASDWAANVFQAANAAIENLNRFVTGGASYMLEMRRQRREGASPEDAQRAAEDYAIDIMYRTNGDARDWNKPSVFNKGPVMRLSTQYKSFPQRVMATFIDSGVAALKLTTAEGRANPENWEKGRRLAALTAVTIGAAGMLGLPTEILKAPLNVLYMLGLSNWNSDDAEAHFRQWTATKFGMVGRVAADGFSALTPFDFQSKLSQSNTFFYSAPQSTKSTDLMAAAFGVIAGAGGHTAVQAKDGINDLVKGTQMIMDGATSQGWLTVQKGLKEVLPVKLLADAMSMGDSLEPRVTPGGKVTRQPLTTVETIGQMMGFQPQRISEERFTKDTVKGLADRFNAERSRLIQEWVQASPTQRVMVQRTIDEFNKRYPDAQQRITRDNMMKAQEAHKKALAAPTSDLGLSLSARTRPFLRDQPVYR